MSLSAIFVALLAWLLFRYLKDLWDLRDFPPGHPRLPIVGCLFSLSDDRVKDAKKLISKYGGIVGYVLGAQR